MESDQLTGGACIAGRYEIQRPLGGGGSAQTYAAFDKTTQSLVAIKVRRPVVRQLFEPEDAIEPGIPVA